MEWQKSMNKERSMNKKRMI
ncbi:hypothetical protein CCACVL1_24341 [Corchorus capsularis]|uniref:Uncharacterized protein n=1 Tax=Corchorus capsularis TaxID=210143 RepID=A0A1R3GPZ4_COCAP|nr:hypothetical protein CCACVL1_24341 [Corchorus capsularis]